LRRSVQVSLRYSTKASHFTLSEAKGRSKGTPSGHFSTFISNFNFLHSFVNLSFILY
jgi:hypothetical protein